MGERRIVRVGVNWFYTGEAMERDEFGLRVGGFVMPRTRATIREGWDCVAEWRREGDHDEKDTEEVDKVNVSLAEAVSGGNCDVGENWLHKEQMQHRWSYN